MNHRLNSNALKIAIPLFDSAGNVEGWYKFGDEYLCPEVRYTSFPPSTWVKIGSRCIEIDRAVPLKIRLLEEDEDYHFWCKKRQHNQRINCGEYHADFGDVEVGYSFSTPQTHIWFAGYAIHADCFENIHISSFNATVRVTPEHVLPYSDANSSLSKLTGKVSLHDLVLDKSLFEMVIEEGADFPIYTAAIPKRTETHKGYITELVPCAEFINDCERTIIKRESFDVGAAVSHISDPVSYPPTFPAVKPFEHPGVFWSFVHNQLLQKRLARDDLELALKDMALLIRHQQYARNKRRKDDKYFEALDRFSAHFNSKEAMHKLTWPVTDNPCKCDLCTKKLRYPPTVHPHHHSHHHHHHPDNGESEYQQHHHHHHHPTMRGRRRREPTIIAGGQRDHKLAPHTLEYGKMRGVNDIQLPKYSRSRQTEDSYRRLTEMCTKNVLKEQSSHGTGVRETQHGETPIYLQNLS